MASSWDWHTRTVCPNCGWHHYLSFRDQFHLHYEVCPECGISTDRYEKFWESKWQHKTMRLALRPLKRIWWNPITWFGFEEFWQYWHNHDDPENQTDIDCQKCRLGKLYFDIDRTAERGRDDPVTMRCTHCRWHVVLDPLEAERSMQAFIDEFMEIDRGRTVT